MFTIECKDSQGWYDHASFATEKEAREEIKNFFEPAFVKTGAVKLIDSDNQIEVEI